ncbi:LANO_0E11980g1_1 [Lachancea nothofagi CBS 11611]|uniref:LANO_0E11980g1_1 n=1 Tax=Lachancea nothofagi CBS 11611 TaxID=1266666 RepID=A0A1G4JXS8_9SACH|nr:LANO_0E11980g1_1 [Lachancea nothofagi CBS 11611]
MSAVANSRKMGTIGKTKSSCSSTSVSSSEGHYNSTEGQDKKHRETTVKQPQETSMAGKKQHEKEQNKAYAFEKDYLEWVDPHPAKPPSYRSANPNRRVFFPVYDTPESGFLPPYSPAVEEITLVSVKMEWLDPYNCSPSRGWKNFIMEINSTQLNFYHIDPLLTKGIKNYCNGRSQFGGENIDPILEYDNHHSIFNSLGSKSTYQFNKSDRESITQRIRKDETKFLAHKKLFRSYSLQFAKFGIPTDYNRKTFVLRLRCETEQFMLSFSHVDDMIMWGVHLSIGIGVALDLDFRELPTYRTVPRRRRRRRRKRNEGTMSVSNSVTRNGSSASPRNAILEVYSPSKKRSNSATSSANSNCTEDFFSSHSAASSRRGSNESIKSKLKSLFGSDKRAGVSSYKSFHNRTMSVTGLNSVVEDEEEDSAPIASASASNTPGKQEAPRRPALDKRSQSMGPMPNNNGNPQSEDYFGLMHGGEHEHSDVPVTTPGSPGSMCSIGGVTIGSGGLQTQTGFHNNVGLQDDLNELNEIIREHNEDGEAVIEEEEEEDEEDQESPTSQDHELEDEAEDGDDDIDSIRHNTTTTTSSIYQDEGIFHDSEDDYYYVMDRSDAFRRRASSVTSNLSSTPYGSEGVKWHPPRKEMSRRRYIRDSLRCIKPLPEDEEWLGKVIVRPVSAPAYETNNPPISGFIFENGKTGRPKASKIKSLRIENGIVLNKCVNHFVKPYVVGPVGLLKTNARC